MKVPKESDPPIAIGYATRNLAYNHALRCFERFDVYWKPSNVAKDGGAAVSRLCDTVYVLDRILEQVVERRPGLRVLLYELGFCYFDEDHPEVQAALLKVRCCHHSGFEAVLTFLG
jgi:hypothetical protein